MLSGRFSAYDDVEDDYGGFGGGRFDAYNDMDAIGEDPTQQASAYGDVPSEDPIFMHAQMGYRTKGGVISSIRAASGALFVAEDGVVSQYNDRSFNRPTAIIEFSKLGFDTIDSIYVDPTASHLLACGKQSGDFKLGYAHLRGNADPVLIRKLQNVKITAVAWNPASTDPSVRSTDEILVGDVQGCVHAMTIDGNERYCDLVHKTYNPTPIRGIHLDLLPNNNYYAMIVTPVQFRQFMSTPAPKAPHFKPLFEDPAELGSGKQEVPQPIQRSQLHAFAHYPQPAQAFAWLTAMGIYAGDYDFRHALRNMQSAVPSFNLIPYEQAFVERSSAAARDVGKPTGADANADIPVALLRTEYHILLLYPNCFRAVCTLNSKAVPGDNFPHRRVGDMKGMVMDPKSHMIYCFADKYIYAIETRNEARDVWRLLLEKGHFSEALDQCKGDAYKENQVLMAHAEALMEEGEYFSAAKKYAQTNCSFETVSLKLLDRGQNDALRLYLRQKLKSISSDTPTKQALLATWMVELYLSSLNAIKAQGPEADSNYQQLLYEFTAFLDSETCNRVLHKDTVMELITSHGNVEALLHYTESQGDFQEVVQHYLHTEQVDRAIAVMREQAKAKPDLVYSFAGTVMQLAPTDLLALCRDYPNLEPRRLIPAFVRYQQSKSPDPQVVNGIRLYLEWVTRQKATAKDTAINNYLISLYVTLEDERPLLKFLKDNRGGKHFDREYALRLSHEHNKIRACVEIYSSMRMFEEAVVMALKIDMDLAVEQVETLDALSFSSEHANELKRKLWLKIAQHVIEQEHNIVKAMQVLEQSQVLKIEDILPLFPDFAKIDQFQDHIQQSLATYNDEIKDLKGTMEHATVSARAIHQEIVELNRKYEVVTGNMSCRFCGYPLMSRPFYVFPCSHAFHKDCLINEVRKYIKPSERRIVQRNMDKLKEADLDPSIRVNRTKLNAEIDEIVGQDCPLCGEMAIRAIEEPFIPDDQLAEYVESWSMGRDQENKLEFGMSEAERIQMDMEQDMAAADEPHGLDMGVGLDDFDPLADLDI
eukprot:TRINITY_DN11287_c0_g1_i1.p1 TRINITY_DN11287_c0_g1~~TRINITY_DN11287_c0_g1_i1.p1  ORF type:complete len:1045 (+),score=297.12 TRINITY_DN11287_c0_g1_i1:107-3241(+)